MAFSEQNRARALAYRAKWMRENYHNTPRGKAVTRKAKLKRLYGITPEDYDRMLVEQGGTCALCDRKPREGRRLAVDHCHSTGRVRGLLCDIHNRAIGYLGDNEIGLQRALDYIRGIARRA
jgi:hypothetical protein